MSAALVDLPAVARARAALVALVAAHPQLAAPEAQARAERWLGEPDMERLDPDHADSVLLTMRIPKRLAVALDAALERWRADNPGFAASRATIARAALLRAFALVPPSAPSAPVEPARAAPTRPASVAAPSAPLSAPQPDQRQLALLTAAPAPVERQQHALADRFTAARERASLTIPAALSELEQHGWPAGGVPLNGLRAELAKPTGALTAEQRAALEGWCRAVEEAPPRPRAPSTARAPSSPRTAEEIERNEALRARYRAAHEAKQLAGEPTAKRIGCSEGTLRHWRDSKLNYLGGDSDPNGQWLTALEGILAELEKP